jgi:hypothetical protein
MNLTASPAAPETHGQQCPPWCISAGDPDPFHVGEYVPVPLSLSGQTLLGRLEHGCTQETTVALVCEDRDGLDLTLAEAEQLRDVLDILIRQAAAPTEGAAGRLDALTGAEAEALVCPPGTET